MIAPLVASVNVVGADSALTYSPSRIGSGDSAFSTRSHARLARETEPLAPALRGLEAERPVRELERRIERRARRMALLRRNAAAGRARSVAASIPERIRRHELRRREHDLAIALERRAVGLSAVHELARDRSDAAAARSGTRRSPTGSRARRVRPSSASARRDSPGARRWRAPRQDALVPGEAALEQLGAVPQREMRRVPPVHLEVRLPEPAVERLARSPAAACVPAHWIAVRYSESTMRRSSSFARGSVLPERSSVPPSLQNRSQCAGARRSRRVRP